MKIRSMRQRSHRSSHNNILKTRIVPLLLAVLVGLSMTACTNINGLSKERGNEITEASEATRTSLETAFTEAETADDLLAPIVAFADEHEIYYKEVNNNSIILIKKNDEETDESLSVGMHCSISLDDPVDSAAKAAAILTALDKSASTSRTTAIITMRDGLFYTGAMALSVDYLDADYMINVSGSDKPVVFLNSTSLDTHKFSHDVTTCKLDNYKSYELIIEDLPRTAPETIDEQQDDPVLMIYEILAWCEQAHLDYRLSSFKAGDAAETLPTSASAVISIDKTDIAKLQNHVFEKTEAFKEKYGTGIGAPTFRLRFTDPEKKAISRSDTTELLGMIYTLLGNFESLSKNESGKVVGRQDISLMDVSTISMHFTMSCRFQGTSEEHDNTSMFEELAHLNNFTVLDREIYPRWTPGEDSLIRMTYERCADEVNLDTSPVTTCDILETGVFAMKKPELTQLAVGMSPDDCAKMSKALVLFIETAEQKSL